MTQPRPPRRKPVAPQDDVVAHLYAEAAADLERLLGLTGKVWDDPHDDAETAVAVASLLIGVTEWDRVMLASVLGVALVRLRAAERGGLE